MECYKYFLSSTQGYDIFTDVKENYPILNSIFGFSKLEFNWDGYNGIPPSITTCIVAYNTALFLQQYLYKHPKIMLTGNNEISLFWDIGDIHIELSIEDNDISFFVAKNKKLILGYDSCQKNYT